MKKVVLFAFVLTLMLYMSAYPCDGNNPNPGSNVSDEPEQNNQSITQNNDPTITQNNDQTTMLGQSTVIETPKPYLSLPIAISSPVPQLSFGEVTTIPAFPVDARLRGWAGEIIIGIVEQTKTTVGKMIEQTINLARDASIKEDLRKCRIICLAHPSTKFYSLGGGIAGGGSGILGTTGISGVSSILPTYGRMTADTVIDIIIVRVVN